MDIYTERERGESEREREARVNARVLDQVST